MFASAFSFSASKRIAYRWVSPGIFLLLGVIFGSQVSLHAYQFSSILNHPDLKTFRHWNTKKKEVTGYTRVNYNSSPDGRYIVEFSENMDRSKSIYSRRTLWFLKESGKLVKCEEIDYRTDLKIQSLYYKDRIQTTIWQEDNKSEIDLEILPDLVPFEVLSHFLRSNLNMIEEQGELAFTLYLPAIAFELSSKGLPKSLSQVAMKATMEEKKKQDTSMGLIETIIIRVEPTSFMVRALLPEDKRSFDFVFAAAEPSELIQFEEGETRTILSSIQ